MGVQYHPTEQSVDVGLDGRPGAFGLDHRPLQMPEDRLFSSAAREFLEILTIEYALNLRKVELRPAPLRAHLDQ